MHVWSITVLIHRVNFFIFRQVTVETKLNFKPFSSPFIEALQQSLEMFKHTQKQCHCLSLNNFSYLITPKANRATNGTDVPEVLFVDALLFNQ